MMRSLLYVSALALVCVVAIWAYRVINDTQDLAGEVEALHAQIAREREAIAVREADRLGIPVIAITDTNANAVRFSTRCPRQ